MKTIKYISEQSGISVATISNMDIVKKNKITVGKRRYMIPDEIADQIIKNKKNRHEVNWIPVCRY